MKRICFILISLLFSAAIMCQNMVNYNLVEYDGIGGGRNVDVMFDLELPSIKNIIWQRIREDMYHFCFFNDYRCEVDTLLMARRYHYNRDCHIDRFDTIGGFAPEYFCIRKNNLKRGIFTALSYWKVDDWRTTDASVGKHTYLNYDIRSGNRLRLNDFFVYDYNKAFTKALQSYCIKKLYEFANEIHTVENFYLADDGIVFVFNDSNTSGYMNDGEIRLKIKWEFAGKWLITRWFILACD